MAPGFTACVRHAPSSEWRGSLTTLQLAFPPNDHPAGSVPLSKVCSVPPGNSAHDSHIVSSPAETLLSFENVQRKRCVPGGRDGPVMVKLPLAEFPAANSTTEPLPPRPVAVAVGMADCS